MHPDAKRADIDDAHQQYADAIAAWERADREHHAASVGVACGTATPGDLATAAARMKWAEVDAMICRHIAGRRWLTGMRYALEDDELKRAALLLLLDVLRPALEPVADRLADVELLTVAGRGV